LVKVKATSTNKSPVKIVDDWLSVIVKFKYPCVPSAVVPITNGLVVPMDCGCEYWYVFLPTESNSVTVIESAVDRFNWLLI